MQQLFIIDRETFEERLAIVLAECEPAKIDYMDAFRLASQAAYSTRLSRVASAAAMGDWEPAKEWCRQERARLGEPTARELMRSIQKVVRDEMEWKRMLRVR
jgi:hypothetical protein